MIYNFIQSKLRFTPRREECPHGLIGIMGTSRDITEIKMIEEELNKKVVELQNAWEQTVTVLSDAVEIKDAYTSGHQKRVAALSVAIGQALGMSVGDITGLKMAALIDLISNLYPTPTIG